MRGYTAFVTYILKTVDGYSEPVHCNYIQSMLLDTTRPEAQVLAIGFSGADVFKFINGSFNTNCTGFTAQEIWGLVQIVNNSGYTTQDEIKAVGSGWTKYEVTDQISGYVSGNDLTAADLTTQVFNIPLTNYLTFDQYNIPDDINYPTTTSTDLSFGDENFFFGNVNTEIKADVYTTNIQAVLGLNDFNSSDNLTWTEDDKVAVSEIGIYSEYNGQKFLVGIGKLNSPIQKDPTVTRTLLFNLDF